MSEPSKNARDLFLAALDREPSERPELLERLCAGNKALRNQVEALLRVHDEPDSLLDSPRIDLGLAKGGPAPIPDLTIDQRLAEKPGTVIGPYKLLQKIGEGGFGVVYAAEQAEPVRRRVALKIIKPGMDTREVVARFEAERQALAMMDHPNIAKVLDAGTTESARPYFVMELVHGIPLTEYCDKTALNTRQRLSLLCDVCHAIQHAHQKGVIHRDIKPSNVLITLQDSKPIATVIDFGVSKAINQQLTEKTLFTAFGQMVGTPQYMSPEQAEMSGLDIDTRSDIYSLGVLMYELLTGTTPLDGQRLRALGYAEIQRIIREEEPLRPSNRISTLGDEATGVAKHRSVNAKQLRDQLSRELDWIVMKALDKDRNRRYETADALASDIDRYLRDQPVEACPPSAAYRLRKFATRNKASVGTAAAIALLLVAAIAVNMSLAVWAERSKQLTKERHSRELQLHTAAERSRKEEAKQRKQAEIQRDTAKAAQQQAAAQREVAQAAEKRARTNFQQARLAVDQYLQTVRESDLLLRPGMSPLRRQLLESARNFFQTFLDGQTTGEASEKETATAHYRLGQTLEELDDRAKAQEEFQTVQPSYEQLVTQQPDDHPLRLELVDICRRLGDLEMAQQQCEAVLEADATHRVAQRTLAALHEAAARQLVGQQQLDDALRRYAEAERILAALTTGDEPDASDLADLAETRYARAQVLLRQQQSEDSLAKYRSGVAAAERARDLDSQTPRFGQLVAAGMRHRAGVERTLQQTDEALRSYQLAESAWSRNVFWFPAFAEFKAELACSCRDRADYQRTLGRTAEADQTEYRLEQLLTRQPRALPQDHYQLAVIFAQLAQPTDDNTDGLSKSATANLPRYAAQAVEQLSLAVRKGYQPESPLDRDALLQPLASRDDFQAVLAESRKQSVAAPGSPASTLAADLPHHLLMLAAMRGVATAQRKLGQLDAAKTTLDQCMTELDRLSAGDPASGKALGNSLMAQRGQTTYALGHLHWQLRRYREAKQAWDQGFALLKKAHDRAGKDENQKLAHTIAAEEGQLTIVFGEIAFWDEAAGHRDNYVKFGPYMSDLKECEIALITLVANQGEHYEDACRYLLDRCDGDHQNFPYTLAQGKQEVLSPEKLVELASEHANSATPPHFSKSILGVCQLRNGNPQEAIGNLTFWLHFHRAQALFRIGEHDAARFWLEMGERQYASSSRSWLGSETLKSPDVAFWNWWEQAVLQVSRAEAWQLIEQRPAADPWACLFEARGYGLVGDVKKSEAAFAEALVPAPETPEVWLASAETRAVLGQHDEAERLFAKALELAPEDPESWIARGKYYLERGLDALADADMMRAAELSNDDLDVFIRSGWWAVGPYPQDVNESFSPEDSPHPSRPVARAGAGGGDNLAPRRWTRVPVDGDAHNSNGHGKLISRVRLDGHLTGYPRNASIYALAYVYSPDARTATLCFGAGYRWSNTRPESQAQMRIRLNGKTVLDWTRCPRSDVALQRLPVQLKAGRNEIRVRISSPVGHSFRLRLGDSPVSRALLAARLGQWQPAVDAFQRIPLIHLIQGGYSLPSVYFACLAAVNDQQQYDVAIAKAYAYGAYTSEDDVLGNLLGEGTLLPNSTMTRDVLLKIVEDVAEPTAFWVSARKGRGLFRAQEYQQAIDWHSKHNLLQYADCQCVVAMAHYELGHEAEASEWLGKAKDDVLSRISDRRAPSGEAFFNDGSYIRHTLLVEAHERITGTPLAEDPTWAFHRKEIDSQLARMAPERADFDLALMLEPKRPRLWVARAQRYASLERWADAERNFAEAVRLDVNNVRTHLASARYWIGRENLDKARDAYAQVLQLDQDLAYREQVLNDLKDNEPLFLALLRTDQTQDWATALWQARGLQLCAQKRWSEAVRVWQRRLELEQPSPLLMYQLALLQTSSGDTSGYAGTCGAIVDRYAQDKIDSASRLAAWACILAPGACDDYTPVLELAQRCRDRDVVNASVRNTLGAVLLRTGRSAEAIAELEKAALWLAGHDNRNASPPAYAWYLLAMAHTQLGDQNAAQQWYDKAQTWTREQAELQPPAVMSWNRELTLSLLQNESAALLKRAIVPVSSEEGRDLCP